MLIEIFDDPILERVTAEVSGNLFDEKDLALPLASIDTFTFTLYLADDSTVIINTRTSVNILNFNGGTLDSLGAFTLTLTPLDNALVAGVVAREKHRILLEWTYSTTKIGRHLMEYTVQPMDLVP